MKEIEGIIVRSGQFDQIILWIALLGVAAFLTFSNPLEEKMRKLRQRVPQHYCLFF